MNYESPLDIKYLKQINDGLISKKNKDINISNTLNIGEIFDLFCVSHNKKPLAALDFSNYGIKKLKKININLINKIIDLSN